MAEIHARDVNITPLTPEEQAARKRRSLWLGATLFAFVAIVFAVTLVKLGAAVLDRSL
jgi:hypothetical protein